MDQVARDLDALASEVEGERFRHVAGIEPAPALAAIFAARPRAAHRATAAALREAGAGELAAQVAAARAERAQAEEEEGWRAAEAGASAPGPDGPVSLPDADLAVLRERDRERRLAFGRAAVEAAGRAASRREAAVEVRARARAEVGLVPDWERVVEGDEVLHASREAWADVLDWAARRELGLAPAPRGDLGRADLLHLAALHRWDGLFRAGMLPVALKQTFEKLGLDLGRARVDAASRPAQWPGVHVLGPRVSFRPRGGAGDWQDLLAGAGRALAASHHGASARDAAFVHAFGAVLGSLVLEPRYLAERVEVEKRHAADLVRGLALRALLALRARAAALRVAAEVERGLSGAAWRESYRGAMSTALLATWEGAWASRDADAPALAAALAGEGIAARLRLELRERFDEDWWRNPRTAGHLAGLLAAGRVVKGAPQQEAAPQDGARFLVEKIGA